MISVLHADTLGVSVVSGSHEAGNRLSILTSCFWNWNIGILSRQDSLNDIDRMIVIDVCPQNPLLQIFQSFYEKKEKEKCIDIVYIITGNSTIFKVPCENQDHAIRERACVHVCLGN